MHVQPCPDEEGLTAARGARMEPDERVSLEPQSFSEKPLCERVPRLPSLLGSLSEERECSR